MKCNWPPCTWSFVSNKDHFIFMEALVDMKAYPVLYLLMPSIIYPDFFQFTLNFEGQVWAAHTVLYTFLYASAMHHNCSHSESSSSNIFSAQKWRRLLKKSCHLHKLTKNMPKYIIMYTRPWCIVFFILHLLLTIHNWTVVFSL